MFGRSILGLVLVLISFPGCAARSWDTFSPPETLSPAAQEETVDPETGWSKIKEIERGTLVAVYLKNGTRIYQPFRYSKERSLFLEHEAVEREQIVLVAVVPKDPIADGVLIGAGVGAVTGLALGLPAEFPGFWLPGLAAGAGTAALLDSGIPTPEKPVYVENGQTSIPWKHWKVPVSAQDLSGWVIGRKVELMLVNGAYFKGKVSDGNAREIRLSVTDSSEQARKGTQTSLSTSQISTAIYREASNGNRGAAGLGGGLAGLLTGGFLGALVAGAADEGPGAALGGGLGGLFGTMAGVGLSDYYMWREVTLVVTK